MLTIITTKMENHNKSQVEITNFMKVEKQFTRNTVYGPKIITQMYQPTTAQIRIADDKERNKR